jgi:hypothetical protein
MAALVGVAPIAHGGVGKWPDRLVDGDDSPVSADSSMRRSPPDEAQIRRNDPPGFDQHDIARHVVAATVAVWLSRTTVAEGAAMA